MFTHTDAILTSRGDSPNMRAAAQGVASRVNTGTSPRAGDQPRWRDLSFQHLEVDVQGLWAVNRDAHAPSARAHAYPRARGLRCKAAGTALTVDAAQDQARIFKHLEVLGNRGLADRERLRKVASGRLAQGQARQDRTAGWVRQGVKGCVQHLRNTLYKYMII